MYFSCTPSHLVHCLLLLYYLFDEVLLELLVAVVDAELLEAIFFEYFEPRRTT